MTISNLRDDVASLLRKIGNLNDEAISIEDDLDRLLPLVPDDLRRYNGQTAEEISAECTEEYGMYWFKFNEVIVNTAYEFGIDPSDSRVKLFFMATIANILKRYITIELTDLAQSTINHIQRTDETESLDAQIGVTENQESSYEDYIKEMDY